MTQPRCKCGNIAEYGALCSNCAESIDWEDIEQRKVIAAELKDLWGIEDEEMAAYDA
jgi:hypothetical protein